MSVTETRLPPDLEREIFEYTADLYPATIPNLLCVAHRVLVWIEPILYRTVHISPEHISAFLTATKSKPPEFFAKHVQRLFITSFRDPQMDDTFAGLALCTGVTRMAGLGTLVCRSLLPVIAGMRLQRIALFLTHIFPSDADADDEHEADEVDLSLPCFQTLTHFDVFDFLDMEAVALVHAAKLCTLPVLTHLSLNGTVPWSAVEMLLQGCRRLQVLVVLWAQSENNGRKRAAQTPFDDVRFVVTRYHIYEEAIWDPPNYWTQARAFIADKSLGKIDARCFWMARDYV
ncbi:hypothetical protein C8F01DRAFT_1228928 [Mycena amicta]|nr:hypothetical protein C8F01DRAFT_1228928 [Mycena amicta]